MDETYRYIGFFALHPPFNSIFVIRAVKYLSYFSWFFLFFLAIYRYLNLVLYSMFDTFIVFLQLVRWEAIVFGKDQTSSAYQALLIHQYFQFHRAFPISHLRLHCQCAISAGDRPSTKTCEYYPLPFTTQQWHPPEQASHLILITDPAITLTPGNHTPINTPETIG